MRKFLFLFFSTCIAQNLIAQKSLILYEQLTFDYFFDSLINDECKNAKTIYYKPEINDKHSELKSPIGFNDYDTKKNRDTSDYPMIRKDQEEILQLDLSKYELDPGKQEKWKVCKMPKKIKKNEWKTSVLIEVFKRYTYRLNDYVVELVVNAKASKTFYFFEIDKNNSSVKRWYKAWYIH